MKFDCVDPKICHNFIFILILSSILSLNFKSQLHVIFFTHLPFNSQFLLFCILFYFIFIFIFSFSFLPFLFFFLFSFLFPISSYIPQSYPLSLSSSTPPILMAILLSLPFFILLLLLLFFTYPPIPKVVDSPFPHLLFIYLFFLFAKTPTHQPTHSFSLIITLFFLHFLGGPLYTQPNTHAWPKIFAILPSFFSPIFFIHPLAKTLADPHFLFQFFSSSSYNPSQTRPHDHTSSTLLSSLFFLLDFFYSSSYHHSFTCSNTTTISHISTRTTFFFFILLSHLLHLILNFFSFSLLLVLFSKTQPFITASETTTSRCWRAIAYQ